MKSHQAAGPPYAQALAELVARIEEKTRGVPPKDLPIRMYVAGGAALHLLTGERVSEDVDASFSRRLLLTEELAVAYRDADGQARPLYLDRSYNDTLGLLHENAHRDSRPVALPGVDPTRIEVRILTPLDLAVSKLSRFSDQDRRDIESLARRGLIGGKELRRRAEEALGGYVGELDAVRNTIDLACRLVDDIRARPPGRRK